MQDEEAEEIDLEAELGVELGTGDDADYEGEHCWIGTFGQRKHASDVRSVCVSIAEEEAKDAAPAPLPTPAPAAQKQTAEQEKQLSKKV